MRLLHSAVVVDLLPVLLQHWTLSPAASASLTTLTRLCLQSQIGPTARSSLLECGASSEGGGDERMGWKDSTAVSDGNHAVGRDDTGVGRAVVNDDE